MNSGDRGWLAWCVVGAGGRHLLVCDRGSRSLQPRNPPTRRPTEFSSGRAMANRPGDRRGRRIRPARPRTSESAGSWSRHSTDLGLSPEIQMPKRQEFSIAKRVGTTEGTGPGGQEVLLLCAHYDTPQYSPGAGHDASGVAARCQNPAGDHARPSLDRDVIALLHGWRGTRPPRLETVRRRTSLGRATSALP